MAVVVMGETDSGSELPALTLTWIDARTVEVAGSMSLTTSTSRPAASFPKAEPARLPASCSTRSDALPTRETRLS